MFILFGRWTSILVEREVFLMKPKHQYHLSQLEECVYSAQSWNEKSLFCESIFIPIEKQASILKIVERKVSLLKAKHQYHLSQWEEHVYSAQSWKKRRLLCESMFIPIRRWISILKW